MNSNLTQLSKNLPPKWKLVPVGRILRSSQYGTNAPGNADGNTSVVGMKDIQDGRVLMENLGKAELDRDERNDLLLKIGDLLINRTNSYDLVGKVGLVEQDTEAVFASYLVRLKVDQEKIMPEYLNYWLNSSVAQRTIKRIATRAVSQANLNPTEFKKHCLVPLPPKDEQDVIVDILTTWDTAIEKTEQLIAAKEKAYHENTRVLISGMNHQRVQVKKIATEVSVRNSECLCERVLSVTNDKGFILAEEQFDGRVASSDVSNYKIVKRGQYAYNPSRVNVGSIARLDGFDVGVISPMYTVFEIEPDLVDTDYFLHWLKSYEAQERIKLSAQGSVRQTVSFGDFAVLPMPLPSIQEQLAISDTLNLAWSEINRLRRVAQLYRDQKQGLMQTLLTGKWKVNNMLWD